MCSDGSGCAADARERVDDAVIVKYAGQRALHPLTILNHDGGVFATGRLELGDIGHWRKDDTVSLYELVCSYVHARRGFKPELQSLVDGAALRCPGHILSPIIPCL